MIQVRNKTQIIGGVLIMILSVFGTISNVSIWSIMLFLVSVYMILDGILDHKAAILSIMFGFVMLISVFIWLITQNASLSSLDVITCFITSILFLVLGMGVFLGFVHEKWLNWYNWN
ncbi:MAG: hypothetical protein ACP5C3_07045 [Methanomicrobiales archaeon]